MEHRAEVDRGARPCTGASPGSCGRVSSAEMPRWWRPARPRAGPRPGRPSSLIPGPARTPASAGHRRTRRTPRRARRGTNGLRGNDPSRTSRTLQVKMRGLSPVAGGGSSVGILTATKKATLAGSSAFACHAQLDAREGLEARLGAGVQRSACRGREGDRYKGRSLVMPKATGYLRG